jgi:hypothetical protein
MSKAPKKHDDDVEEKTDSVKHHEERKAKIEAENEQNKLADIEVAENQEIANFKGFPVAGETRDQLLDRIRKMREAPPKEPEAEPFRSEGQMKEFLAEQEVGRAAVAKAEAEAAKYREALARSEGGEKK